MQTIADSNYAYVMCEHADIKRRPTENMTVRQIGRVRTRTSVCLAGALVFPAPQRRLIVGAADHVGSTAAVRYVEKRQTRNQNLCNEEEYCMTGSQSWNMGRKFWGLGVHPAVFIFLLRVKRPIESSSQRRFQ
jgi:hypothetical protein